MKSTPNLTLHNWRIFDKQDFALPNHSFAIIDQNGTGKTSLVSAIYTILTKKAWPGTKFSSNLKIGSDYFGISTEFSDWSFTGQIGPSGRLLSKYTRPEGSIDFLGQELNYGKNWPRVLTYLPTDNYWLSMTRSQKLGILDNLLGQIFDINYHSSLLSLTKNVESLGRLIRFTNETGKPADFILVETLQTQILHFSQIIWQYRQQFLLFLETNLPEFSSWINSPLKNWQIVWQIAQTETKININLNSNLIESILEHQRLWNLQLRAGKVLIGAQRDDFWISSDHLLATEILSRGEMRLLVLFIKSLATNNQLNPDSLPIWWLLDDIFNELDDKREQILYSKILVNSNKIIATSTKNSLVDLQKYTVAALTN